MMEYYTRADGTLCEAVQFKGLDADSEAMIRLIEFIGKHDMRVLWVDTKPTDEYEENEEGEIVEIITPEHLKVNWEDSLDDDGNAVELGGDEAKIGDWVVKRDGEIYFMDGGLFDAIWSRAVTDNIDEWDWVLSERLPYSKKAGYWRHKNDHDIVSNDGGVSHFRLSERPQYQSYGKLYLSAKVKSEN